MVSERAPRGAAWDRLAVMTMIRLLLIAWTIGAPMATDSPREGLVALSAAYFGVTIAAELVRRFAHPFAIRAAVSLAVLDGAFVILAIVASGGPTGPLAAEVYLLVGAAAVLVSPSAGLGVAFWCALMQAGARAGEDLDWWSLPGRVDRDGGGVVRLGCDRHLCRPGRRRGRTPPTR